MRIASVSGILGAALSLAACSESRFDPCGLLAVADAKSLDSSVTSALWAGRGEPKAENEVCLYYDVDGDPRLMLFVWYDNEASPRELVAEGSEAPGAIVTDLELPRADFRGAASFADGALALLALQSDTRTIGFRVREPVRRDSVEFEALLRLSQAALARF